MRNDAFVKWVLLRLAIAMAAAVIVNVAIYGAGAWVGADYVVPDSADGSATTELSVLGIVGGTVIPMALGGLLWLAVGRFSWGWKALCGVAGLVVVLTFLPFSGPWQTLSKLALGLMHITTPVAFFAAVGPGSGRVEPR